MQERDGYRLLRQGTFVPSVLIVRVADPDLDPDPVGSGMFFPGYGSGIMHNFVVFAVVTQSPTYDNDSPPLHPNRIRIRIPNSCT